MKFCYACGHTTGGGPLFCNSCGGSYDVKLCPKLHANPRLAEACSQCGSRDLSVPQPRVPLSWHVLVLITEGVSGLLLFCFSFPILLVFLTDLFRGSAIGNRLSPGAISATVLWSLWTELPGTCRQIIHRSLLRKSGFIDNANTR
jgi:hypothetical protein